MSEVRFLTSKEAAAKIGVAESYLRQCRMTGVIGGGYPAPPYRQMGRSIRYEESELEAWMQAMPKRCFVATTEPEYSGGEMQL